MTYLTIYRYFTLILYYNSTIDKVDKYVFFREKNAHNLSAFKDELGKINWAEMPGLNDPSCAYEIFVGKYTTNTINIFHSEK